MNSHKSCYVFERCVTKAEADKGHITIPAEAVAMFEEVFGALEPEDQVSQESLLRCFYLGDTGEPVELKLCRRNAPRTEVRLYFNARRGFKAGYNEIFRVEFRAGRAWLSKRASGVWVPEKLAFARVPERFDKEELRVNLLVKAKQTVRWKRSRDRAEACMESAGYRCQAGWNAHSFAARSSGKNFVEVHHMIPLALQPHFRVPLDAMENLVCVSPAAHRALHLAEAPQVRELLAVLLPQLPLLTWKFGVTQEQLCRIYRVS